MGFALLPLAAIIFFVGIMAVQQTTMQHVIPSNIVVKTQWGAQSFVAYRDAVSAYMQRNPTFTGEIPAADLNAPFSEEFLTIAGNKVNAINAGRGRVIISYATLPPGAIRTVRMLTQNDISINEDSSGTVTSMILTGV